MERRPLVVTHISSASPQFRSRVSAAAEVAVRWDTLWQAFRRISHAETNCRAFVYILYSVNNSSW